VDVDILKPDTGYLSIIERPHYNGTQTTTSKGPSQTSTSRTTLTPTDGSASPGLVAGYTEPLSEGEEEEQDFIPAHDEGKRTGLSGAEVTAAIAYREQMLKERREEEEEDKRKRKRQGKEKETDQGEGDGEAEQEDHDAEGSQEGEPPAPVDTNGALANGQPKRQKLVSQKSTLSKKALSINPLAPSSTFDETLKTKLEGEERRRLRSPSSSRVRGSRSASRRAYGRRNDEVEDHEEEEERRADEMEEEEALGGPPKHDDRILERNWRAPPGKKIAIPVRIEPKVYFAAERTFLVSLTPFVYDQYRMLVASGLVLRQCKTLGAMW
jgi:hypothetical protein